MAIRKIVKDSDPQLRKRSRDVELFDSKLHRVLDDMLDTMRDADGVGLAAPQIGLLRNFAIVEIDDTFLELINPKITASEGSQLGMEGCLSVESRNCNVNRPSKITIKYQDRHGNHKTITVSDLPARVCCHEIDHLFGIIFYDRAEKD